MRNLCVVFVVLVCALSKALAQTPDAAVVPPMPTVVIPQNVQFPADPTKFKLQYWLPKIWPIMFQLNMQPKYIPSTISIEACVSDAGATIKGDSLCIGNYSPIPENMDNPIYYHLLTHELMHLMFDSGSGGYASQVMEGMAEGKTAVIYQKLGYPQYTYSYTVDQYNNLRANAVAGQFFTQQWTNRYLAAAGLYEVASYVLGGFGQMDQIRNSITVPYPNNELEFYRQLNLLPARIDGVGVGTYLSRNVTALSTGTPGASFAVFAADGMDGVIGQIPFNPRYFQFEYAVHPQLSKPPKLATYPAAVVKYWVEDYLGKTIFSSTYSFSASVFRPGNNGVAAPPLNYPYQGRYTVKACISPDGGQTCSADPNLSANYDYNIWNQTDWKTNKMFVFYRGTSTLRSVNDPSVSVAMYNGLAVVTGAEGKNILLTDGTTTRTFTWFSSPNHLSPIKLWDRMNQPVISSVINSFRTDKQEIADTTNGVRPTVLAAGSYASILGWGLFPDDPMLELGCTAGCKDFPAWAGGNLGQAQVWLSSATGVSWPVGLLNVGWNQIDFLVSPYFPQGPATLTVYLNGTASNSWPVTIANVAPGLSTRTTRETTNFINAVKESDWSTISADNPAHAGDVIVVFATGLGPFWPADWSPVMLPVSVTLGNYQAQTGYAGLQSGWLGLYIVEIVVPQAGPPGTYRLVVTVNGQESNQTSIDYK